jgi:hypothetical protein
VAFRRQQARQSYDTRRGEKRGIANLAGKKIEILMKILNLKQTLQKLRKEEREEYEKRASRIDLDAWLNDSIAVDTARAKKQQEARSLEDEEMKNWLAKIFGSASELKSWNIEQHF